MCMGTHGQIHVSVDVNGFFHTWGTTRQFKQMVRHFPQSYESHGMLHFSRAFHGVIFGFGQGVEALHFPSVIFFKKNHTKSSLSAPVFFLLKFYFQRWCARHRRTDPCIYMYRYMFNVLLPVKISVVQSNRPCDLKNSEHT